MSEKQNTAIVVEGVNYPVEPIEILGFSSPLSDPVIQVLFEQARSRSNGLQQELLSQIEQELKRSRTSEVVTRKKVIAFSTLYSQAKDKLEKLDDVPAQTTQSTGLDVLKLNHEQIELVKKAAIWIRAKTLGEVKQNGLDKCLHQNEVISDADIKKSSLFARICKGKDPLVSIPPTAFGQPWYEILESTTEFKVVVDFPRTVIDKLVSSEFDSIIGEVVFINNCEWKISKVENPGHHYILKWSYFNFDYSLKRRKDLLDSHNGSEQGWTLQKLVK